jgi:hypothetical protein
MTVEQKVLRKVTSVLDLKKLKKALPREPHVVRIESEEYVNADGEDALKVMFVLSDDTTLAQLTGENVVSLKSAIYNALRAERISLFPYIFLTSEAELKELNREEEEE